MNSLPQAHVLATDWLVYLLLVVIVASCLYIRRHEHLSAPWRQIVKSRQGVSALIILITFVVVGLLDSVHYRPIVEGKDNQGNERHMTEVYSLLDTLLVNLKNNQEKTYSAPFAIHLFNKETVELPGGEKVRAYQRLKYGGAHLNSLSERSADIMRTVFWAVLQGVLLTLLAGSLFLMVFSRKKTIKCTFYQVIKKGEGIPWAVIFVTLGVILTTSCVTLNLAADYHVLGTDKVGQDVLYQSLKSIRTGLVIGTLTTLIMLPFAIMLGVMAGYFRGIVDDVIQYLYTTLSSIPGVLLIAAAVLMLQVYMAKNPELFTTDADRADTRLLYLCIILGITSWAGLCRYLRAETLKIRELDYIQASAAFGVKSMRILTRHIVPNVMHIVLITIVLDFSGLVLAEAVLAYVGVGVDPTMNSWGNMINAARLEMAREPMVWWSLSAAIGFMFILVLAANLFSDAVRDAFDPRMRK